MIIKCQECDAEIRLDEGEINPLGMEVKCTNCGVVFFFEGELFDEHENDKALEIEKQNVTLPLSDTDDSYIEDLYEEMNSYNEQLVEESSFSTSGQGEQLKKDIDDTQPHEDVETSASPDQSSYDKTQGSSNDELKFDLDVLDKLKPESDKMTEDVEESDPPDQSSYDKTQGSSNDELKFDLDVLDKLKPESDKMTEDVEESDPPDQSSYDKTQGSSNDELKFDLDVLDKLKPESDKMTEDVEESDPPDQSSRIESSEQKQSRGFLGKIFVLIIVLFFSGVLITLSSFLLDKSNVYPNDYYSKIGREVVVFFENPNDYYNKLKSTATDLIEDYTNLSMKMLEIVEENGRWISSKHGQIYVVSGSVVNRSNEPISFVKLKVGYISEDVAVYSQEIYAGNLLSDWAMKNQALDKLYSKLTNKKGQINYKNFTSVNGLNSDIKPNEKVPFSSFFPARNKILGLKFKVDIIGYESSSK